MGFEEVIVVVALVLVHVGDEVSYFQVEFTVVEILHGELAHGLFHFIG